MRTYLNLSPVVQRAVLASGNTGLFGPRALTAVSDEEMSAEVQALVNKGILKLTGVTSAPPITATATPEVTAAIIPAEIEAEASSEAKSYTSSDKHHVYDNLSPDREEDLSIKKAVGKPKKRTNKQS